MKTQMSLAAVSLGFALASACAKDKPAPSSGDPEPATQEPGASVPTDGPDPNFDPSASPDDLDKKADPGNGDPTSVDERKMTFAFDAEKLAGTAGEAVVITIDHKKVTSNQKCATPVERTPISESGYDPNATTLVVEVVSFGAVRDDASDTVAPDFEISETFSFSCGKSPLSITMQNMDTGHQVELSLTVHTAEASVFAEAKPFIALNKSDGEKALTLDYPSAD